MEDRNENEDARRFFPLPLWERVASRESGEPGEGSVLSSHPNPSPDASLRSASPSPTRGEGKKEPEIAANPYVLQELAKEPGTREHEIISRRRREMIKPHGYPLSGRDGAGKRVLFHSGEKEKSGAGAR